MDSTYRDIESLLLEAKKQQDVCKRKQQLEKILASLTVCQNVSVCYKKLQSFSTNLLKVNCEVVSSMGYSEQRLLHTLIIRVENVSKDVVFSCEHWKFRIATNHNRTHSTCSLENDLRPGQKEMFSFPLNRHFLVEIVQISLEFVIQFEAKTYTRSFNLEDLIVDVLHCLDPGKGVYETATIGNDVSLVESMLSSESTVKFPVITQFILKVNQTLKDIFLRNVLLCDSFHRGFMDLSDSTKDNLEMAVYFSGHKIDIVLKKDFVAVKCGNPRLLCSMKAAIIRRFAKLDGITIDTMDDDKIEKLHAIRLKLTAFESGSCDNADLIEYYLKFRDISESIVFSLTHVVLD